MPAPATRIERRGAAEPGEVRIGVSGWRYPPWRGAFYPAGLPQRRELEFASRRFDTLELNGSFYSLQRPVDYANWHEATPPGFVFAVKGPRYVTHLLALREVEIPLANFFASGLANLRGKLGPLLWQLPPRQRFDRERIAAFLALLPHDTAAASELARRHDDRVAGRAVVDFGDMRPLRHALEVRHPSFVDASFVALLREHGVALVVADTAGKWPRLEDVTADFVYLRLHGDATLYVSGYARSALERWAARIGHWRAGGEPDDAARASPIDPAGGPREVFCYFDNDVKVRAPVDAQNLRRLVDGGQGAWARLRRSPGAKVETAREQWPAPRASRRSARP